MTLPRIGPLPVIQDGRIDPPDAGYDCQCPEILLEDIHFICCGHCYIKENCVCLIEEEIE